VTISDSYRWWLDIPGQGRVQVYPMNSSLKWSDSKKKGYRFYQRLLDDNIILMDRPAESIADFQLLMDMERSGRTCERVDVYVDKYCDCTSAWVVDWYAGYLRLSKGEWDVSHCTVKIPIEVNDNYTCLTTEWSKDMDIFDYGDPPEDIDPYYGEIQYETCEYDHTITINKIVPFEEMLAIVEAYFWDTDNYADDCIDSTEGWKILKHSYIADLEIKLPDLFDWNGRMRIKMTIRTQWVREFVSDPTHATTPPGVGWLSVTDGWARQVPTQITDIWTTEMEGGREHITEYFGTNNYDIGLHSVRVVLGLNEDGSSVFTNGKTLNSVIEDWLSGCDITVISNFFNINPDATNPDNDYYTNAAVDAHALYLFQVTDIARIDETESATIALTNFKKIIDALKMAFNVDIELEGDVVRIEHVSYWEREVNMDLTQLEFIKWIDGKWKYTYDQAKLPQREEYKWGMESDKAGGDFDGWPIEYDNNCVNDTDDPVITEIIANQFITNVRFVINNEDFFDSELLVLVSTTAGVINSAIQPLSGNSKLNGNLALGYLLPRYHTHSRPFKTGFINKNETTFYRSLRLKIQEAISFPMQCDDYMNNYDPAGLIKTQLGAGEIDKATYHEPAGKLTVTLRHK
jgi:hypothetical protein